MVTDNGKTSAHFGGYVREMFRDAATIEIDNSAVLRKGEVVTVAKSDFAAQSFATGVGPGDYVEGVVFSEEGKPKEYKFITKII